MSYGVGMIFGPVAGGALFEVFQIINWIIKIVCIMINLNIVLIQLGKYHLFGGFSLPFFVFGLLLIIGAIIIYYNLKETSL